MQMFGVGILELLVILVITAIIVGPERMPQVAADLARWIRRARAYGQHLTRDFSDVVSELEREAGVSREDWKEIASVVTRQTGDLTKELEKVAGQVELSGDLELAKAETPPANVVPFETTRSEEPPADGEAAPAPAEGTPESAGEEEPWFVPQTPSSRRRRRE